MRTRRKTFFVIIIIPIFFFSCINKEKKIPLYNVKPIIYNILDSIIILEKKCPDYDKIFLFTCTKRSDFYQITIEGIPKKSYDCSDSFGLFKYKKNIFICRGLLLNKLLSYSGCSETIQCPVLQKNEFTYLNDEFSIWFYGIKNDEIYFIGKNPCSSPF